MRSSAYSRSLSTRRPERDGCRLPTAGRTCEGFFAAGAFDLGVLGELKTCRGFAGGDGLVRAAGGMGDAGGDPCWEELVDAWPPCFCCWRLARRSAAWRKKSSRLSLIGLVACSCVSKERLRSRGTSLLAFPATINLFRVRRGHYGSVPSVASCPLSGR
jgi:hypothetical protein